MRWKGALAQQFELLHVTGRSQVQVMKSASCKCNARLPTIYLQWIWPFVGSHHSKSFYTIQLPFFPRNMRQSLRTVFTWWRKWICSSWIVLFSFGQFVDRVYGWFSFNFLWQLISDIFYKVEWKIVTKLKITLCCHHMSQLGGGQSPNYSMSLPV